MADKVLIPENTEWFIGELVEEFKAADQAGNLVHINTILIKADSPGVAYHKSIALGESADRVFTNTAGVDITVRFRGLRGLYAVYYRLEDGAEPLYEERVGMSDEAMVGGPDRDSAAHNAEIRRATKRSAVTTEQLLLSLKASPPMEVLANPSLPAMERRAIAATRNAAASAVPTVQVAAEAAAGTCSQYCGSICMDGAVCSWRWRAADLSGKLRLILPIL